MHDERQTNPFDRLAQRYDRWFDSTRGQAIFEAEVACLQALIPDRAGQWLEVGVGTGRFAQALGVPEGVDPSRPVLEMARQRGIRARHGYGEELPHADGSYDGLLMVVTLCFLANPGRAFQECSRVLKDDGYLVAGLVPADSSWGELYARSGRKGHPFYAAARFYTVQQVLGLAAVARLVFSDAMSCLLSRPGELVDDGHRRGIVDGAGFVGLKLHKAPSVTRVAWRTARRLRRPNKRNSSRSWSGSSSGGWMKSTSTFCRTTVTGRGSTSSRMRIIMSSR